MIAVPSIADLLRGLREQKARTVTTLLGLGWGAFSVIVLLAFGIGLEGHMRKTAENLGRSIAIVWPQRTTKHHAGLGRGRRIRLRLDDVVALSRQIPELGPVSPEFITHDRLEVGETVHRVTISGVLPAYRELRSWTPQPGGRFLNDRDVAERRRVIVLGDRVRAGLFGHRRALGERVILRGLPFTVVGVLTPKRQDSNYSGLDADRICLPATTFERVFGIHTISNFVYRARSPDLHARATRRIYDLLGRRLKFDPTDRQALQIWDTTEEERLRHYAFLGFHIMLGGSGIVTLLVGAVGVGNLMFIRVRRRTREIGIQMALGARPRWILTEVLVETGFLVALGGGLGFLLAWIVIRVVGATSAPTSIGEPKISLTVAGVTIALLGIVALLAGFFPARRAARLDPVRALAEG